MTLNTDTAFEADNLIDRISTAAGAFAGSIMVLVSIFIGYEILSRALFSEPTAWVYDISTYSLVWFSFIAAGFVLKEKHHLSVDLLISRCSARVKVTSGLFSLALMATLIGFILVYAYGDLARTFSSGELEPTIIRTPSYLVIAGMVLGLLVFFLQIVREFVKTARSWKSVPRADRSYVLPFGNSFVFLLLVLICLGAGVYLLSNDWPGLGLFLLLISLLLAGVPVFTCLGVAGTIGILFVFGTAGLPQLAQISYKATHSNTLLAIPLYVLAGQILLAGRLGPELFNFAAAWIGHIRGGFAVATLLACGVFAAISGSSIATAAAIGILAIPEMLKRGYKPHFAYGIVAAGGTLGILIPPSTPLILYSGMTDESTGALFMAGVVPGVLLLVIFSIYAVWASDKSTSKSADLKDRIAATKSAIWGLLAPVIVLVGIYTGIFTPTEAAAVAVIYGLMVGLIRKTIRVRDLQSILAQGVLSSGMIMMIIVGAILLGMVTTVLQLPQNLLDFVQDLNISRWVVMAILAVIYVILGMFLEVVSILLITLPIVYPLITSLGFNGVWFAILLVILMEVSLITPPVGMNLFVVQGITRARLGEVVRGVWPFILLMFLILGLIAMIPELALWLPGTMGFKS